MSRWQIRGVAKYERVTVVTPAATFDLVEDDAARYAAQLAAAVRGNRAARRVLARMGRRRTVRS